MSAAFHPVVEEFWQGPRARGSVLPTAAGLTLVIDAEPAGGHPLSLLTTSAGALAVVSTELAESLDLSPATSEALTTEGLRALIAEHGLTLHDPDRIFHLPFDARPVEEHLPWDARDRLLAEPDAEHARVLSPAVAAEASAFEAFLGACSEEDIDAAYVELDHWLVVGAAFPHGETVTISCAASAYPWGGAALADMGVLTRPDARGRGLGRTVVRAMLRAALARGHEPLYRSQLDNPASLALAAAAGLVAYGDWEVVPGGE